MSFLRRSVSERRRGAHDGVSAHNTWGGQRACTELLSAPALADNSPVRHLGRPSADARRRCWAARTSPPEGWYLLTWARTSPARRSCKLIARWHCIRLRAAGSLAHRQPTLSLYDQFRLAGAVASLRAIVHRRHLSWTARPRRALSNVVADGFQRRMAPSFTPRFGWSLEAEMQHFYLSLSHVMLRDVFRRRTRDEARAELTARFLAV